MSMTSSAAATAADDELAMAKAAAWAWYQHGSGSDDRTARESDLGWTEGAAAKASRQRPSRYKLEALAAVEELGPAVPLLDVYEIERITRELERLIMASDGRERRGRARDKEAFATPRTTEGRRAAGKASGSWVGHAAGICGAAGDALEPATRARRRRRRAAAMG
ncbi:unnamed protein product [Musa acuminata subsp. burmannicoides]